MRTCGHCEFEFTCSHNGEHSGICCDCYDLSWGMPLNRLNRERASKGKPPIVKPWPKEQ